MILSCFFLAFIFADDTRMVSFPTCCTAINDSDLVRFHVYRMCWCWIFWWIEYILLHGRWSKYFFMFIFDYIFYLFRTRKYFTRIRFNTVAIPINLWKLRQSNWKIESSQWQANWFLSKFKNRAKQLLLDSLDFIQIECRIHIRTTTSTHYV